MTIQDLQHYRQLIESSANTIITEDYDSRIANLADVVMQKAAAMPGKINKADLERMIRVGINWGPARSHVFVVEQSPFCK